MKNDFKMITAHVFRLDGSQYEITTQYSTKSFNNISYHATGNPTDEEYEAAIDLIHQQIKLQFKAENKLGANGKKRKIGA